ncbi:MerR family DNA-binding transcriptional regulator [Pseudonocardia sichuanensis]
MAVGHRLTVSEASRALGLSRTTLLAAEEAGLLRAQRTPGGHRRYDPDELRRYAGRTGGDGPWEEAGAATPGGATDPGTTGAEWAAIVAAVRPAVRAPAGALDADSAGLYLRHAGTPRFAAAFGVPRWLAERLTADPAPAPVTRALTTSRPSLFDPAEEGFPEPRATGQGVAVALPGETGPLGVLFVVTRRDLLAGEVRVVEAFGEVLALLVQDRGRIATLEGRLTRIAALSAPS